MELSNDKVAGVDGRCPHCGKSVQFKARSGWSSNHSRVKGSPPVMTDADVIIPLLSDRNSTRATISSGECPACNRTVIVMQTILPDPTLGEVRRWKFIWPEGVARDPIPAAVPDHIADDYRESVMVLPYSPKASAALSRRCLQHLLHEQGFTNDNLAKQIDAAAPHLSGGLGDQLHALRQIGNMAAHPMKSTATGMIVGVEDGEAEWNLEVLELLFHHYYTRPEDIRARRDALNKKLVAAGKKPLA